MRPENENLKFSFGNLQGEARLVVPPIKSILMKQITLTSDSVAVGSPVSEGLIPSIAETRRARQSGPNGYVLVIDDEASILNLMRDFLKPHDIKVQLFTNPFDALQWFELHWSNVDLIFLDMKNPHMDGEYCFALLQSIDSEARIALMSGGVDSAIIEELLEEGALRFFQKPLDFQAVIKWALYHGMGKH